MYTAQDILDSLMEMEENGVDLSQVGVEIVYQPDYPLKEGSSGFGFRVDGGKVTMLVSGSVWGGNDYATGPDLQAFHEAGTMLDEEDEEEDGDEEHEEEYRRLGSR